jgi:sulfur-carrier protein adenylyltransferase/sulfurtransferase
MTTLRIPAALQPIATGVDELTVNAETVGEALVRLIERFPVLRRHLYDDAGALRGFVNVYLNDQDVRYLKGQGTPVRPTDVITIVPSVAGGAGELPSLNLRELGRYSRHIALNEVGLEGQRKLKAARVLVVGVGGLGSPIALYLSAAGVGTIGLIDYDTIDITNLQRQVLFRSDDIGSAKVQVAASELRRLNPEIDVVEHNVRLTRDNALDIIPSYDIVIDGTDNFPTRYLVNDACVLARKPYVYGSILRFDGQVSVFDAQRGPCYRCLFREPPPPGLVPSCAEGGVLGVLPGIIGSLQALEAIKLILGRSDTLVGRLVLFDALRFRWRELELRKNPECPVCGAAPTITGLIDYDEFCGVKNDVANDSDPLPELSAGDLKERLDAGERLTLIDVREPFEWNIANLGAYGAKLIPLSEFGEQAGTLNPADEIVVYCRSGARSANVVDYLVQCGFPRVWNLRGGINEWARVVDPAMPTY